MTKQSFIGFLKPRLNYEKLTRQTKEPRLISTSGNVTFLLEEPYTQEDSVLLKSGDKVKIGQRLALYENSEEYVISTAAGTIESVIPQIGDFGKRFTQIIVAPGEEEVDTEFAAACEKPNLETAVKFLAKCPGKPQLKNFCNPDKPINTIIVNCLDQDLPITTNLYSAVGRSESLKAGIKILKQITGIGNIIVVGTKDIFQNYGHLGAAVKSVENSYPNGNYKLVAKDVLGATIPPEETAEDAGIAFLNAEAVASIGDAFQNKRIPENKLVTVVSKDGTKTLVAAKIGASASVIFKELGIEINDADRIIFGGMMTGKSVFTEDFPITEDTDGIIIQDKEEIPFVSNYACMNCGECVRICPVNIQVNLLVRFLEAGLYERAAEECDLHYCIECGLCSYVCVSRMPVFQYIKLGKYELSRIETEETVEETTEETDNENNE